MDDTDKWASNIINELFEDDMNGNFKDPGIAEAKDVVEGTMKNKSRDSRITVAEEAMKENYFFPGNISVGTEYEFPRSSISGSSMESVEEFKSMFLKPNDYLTISYEDYNNLSHECSVIETSSSKNLNNYINSVASKHDDFSYASEMPSVEELEEASVDTDVSETFANCTENEIIRKVIIKGINSNENAVSETITNDTENEIITKIKNIENAVDRKQQENCDVLEVCTPNEVFTEPLKTNIEMLSAVLENENINKKKTLDKGDIKEETLEEENIFAIKRFDERLKSLEIKNWNEQQKVEFDNECIHSDSLTDLHYEYLLTNFIQEEMEPGWNGYDPTNRRKHEENTKQNPNEETNELGNFRSSIDVSSDLQIEISSKVQYGDTNAISQHSVHDLKQENDDEKITLKSEYDEISEKMCNIDSNQNVGKKYQERKIIRKNHASSGTSSRENNCTRCFSIESDNFITKNAQNLSLDSRLDDEVVYDITIRIISIYRHICTAVEKLIIIPFAIFVGESSDFIIFVLALCACLFYFLFKKTKDRLCIYYNEWDVAHLNKSSTREKEVIVMNCNEDSNRLTNSEECEGSEEAKTEEDSIKIASEVKEINEQFGSFNPFVLIDPKNVLIINAAFEQIERNLKDIHKNSADFDEFLQKEQRKAEIKSFGNDSVSVTMLEVDTIKKTDFDTEIIASSKNVSDNQHESGKCDDLFEMCENLSNLEKVSNEDGTSDVDKLVFSGIKTIFSKDDSYILNSTEIDDSKYMKEIKCRSSSDFNILSLTKRDCEIKSTDITDIGNGIKKSLKMADGDKSSSLITLDMIELENIQTDYNPVASSSKKNEKNHGNFTEENFKNKSPSMRNIIAQQQITNSEESNSANAIDCRLQYSDIMLENCLQYDVNESIQMMSICDTSTELDSLVELEEADSWDQKKSSTNRSGRRNLRHRMSVILNNWKNMEVMQCMTANYRRKKYKRHVENAKP